MVTFAGVTRRFGALTAVERLSVEIHPGETVALLGPNGAGKTTTLEMLLGLQQPDTGVVRVFGGPAGDGVACGRLGAMLQEGGLPKRALVGELVAFVCGLYPHPMRPQDALGMCDLEHLADRRAERLSGGEQQRVRLALALAGHPDLLVLDEPTAAMDVAGRRAFWEQARAYVAEGRTVLFATHRLEEADQVADRILVLSGGRLVADGAPGEIKARVSDRGVVRFSAPAAPLEVLERLPAVQQVELARDRVTLYTSDPDRTVRAALDRLPGVEDLEVARAPLEEAFVALTDDERP